jgi:hypothetical protein
VKDFINTKSCSWSTRAKEILTVSELSPMNVAMKTTSEIMPKLASSKSIIQMVLIDLQTMFYTPQGASFLSRCKGAARYEMIKDALFYIKFELTRNNRIQDFSTLSKSIGVQFLSKDLDQKSDEAPTLEQKLEVFKIGLLGVGLMFQGSIPAHSIQLNEFVKRSILYLVYGQGPDPLAHFMFNLPSVPG